LLLLIIVILPPITSIIETSDIYEAIIRYNLGPETKAYGSSAIIYAIVGFIPTFIMFYYQNKPNKSTVDWVSFSVITLGIVVFIFSVLQNFSSFGILAEDYSISTIHIHYLSLILGLWISFLYLKRQNSIKSENI
jgi:magnesium-transporting ATPase (P-type)